MSTKAVDSVEKVIFFLFFLFFFVKWFNFEIQKGIQLNLHCKSYCEQYNVKTEAHFFRWVKWKKHERNFFIRKISPMNGNRKIKWPRMLQIDRIKCNYMHTNTNVHEADDSQVNKIIIIDYLNNTQCTLQTVGLIIIDILNPLIKWYFELKYLLSFLHCST